MKKSKLSILAKFSLVYLAKENLVFLQKTIDFFILFYYNCAYKNQHNSKGERR